MLSKGCFRDLGFIKYGAGSRLKVFLEDVLGFTRDGSKENWKESSWFGLSVLEVSPETSRRSNKNITVLIYFLLDQISIISLQYLNSTPHLWQAQSRGMIFITVVSRLRGIPRIFNEGK